MWVWLACFLTTVLCVSPCVEECEAGPNDGMQFCGLDHISHPESRADFADFCYLLCNVTTLWPGTCHCPNDCLSHGECSTGGCMCDPGWEGRDCSSVSCPKHNCTGHGKCIPSSPESAVDYCSCNPGWTGQLCDIPFQILSPLPYGDAYPNIPYWADDKYQDNNPIFNISVLADMRINVSQAEYETMLFPPNLYHHNWMKGSMWFDNDIISGRNLSISFKMKGFSSRLFPKNSFKLKLSKRWYGTKTIGLRAFCCDGTFMKDVISADFFRFMKVPFYRGSHASIWINNIYHGLYMIHEDLNADMALSRFGNAKGNLYKGARACFEYEGRDPLYYKNKQVPKPPAGSPMAKVADLVDLTKQCYQQKDGNGDFSDLVKLITILNITDKTQFEKAFESFFDVDLYLRSLVVESFTNNLDGYARNCNNWAMYNNPTTSKFSWIPHDVDATFEGNHTSSIVSFPSLLTRRVLQNSLWKSNFLQHYKKFMNQFTLPQLMKRIDDVAVVLNIGSQNDRYGSLYHDYPNVPYLERVAEMKKWIGMRHAYVSAVLSQ